MPTSSAGWTVVLPVKGGQDAKSRLGAATGLSASGRTRLALAFALDCLAAVLAAPAVLRAVVVTGDAGVAREVRHLGAEVVGQRADRPGLGAAVRTGLAVAGPGPTAVLLADLPALRPADVQAVLEAALRSAPGPDGWVVVPDAAGDGSVAIAAARTEALRPRFGPGSAAAHAAAGATTLVPDLPRLRQDVDLPADLATVLELGAGPRTLRTLADVQATVLDWDADTAKGAVVTDDGVRLRLAPDALHGSGLRHLRPGQRVTCSAGSEPGCVTDVRINGIGDR